jgi:hypothetical protein
MQKEMKSHQTDELTASWGDLDKRTFGKIKMMNKYYYFIQILALFLLTTVSQLVPAQTLTNTRGNGQSLDLLIRDRPPVQLHRLSPYVVDDAFPFALPAVEYVRARLTLIERAAQGRGLSVHHNFQALYGSNFLRSNPVGNDLDYILGVHLGPVRLRPEQPGLAAETILSRIESYLQVLSQSFVRYETPEIAVLKFPPLEDDHLIDRENIYERLTASLSDVAQGQPHRPRVRNRAGQQVPDVLSPEESYIHALTRIKFLSNRVRSVDWMFPGIRGLQMMFHFFCRLKIETGTTEVKIIEVFPLHPTFLPSGQILRIEEQLLWTVPVDTPSAAFFTSFALSDPDFMATVRLKVAQQLLAGSQSVLGTGNITKALKRLRGAQEALSPVLKRDFSEELGREVAIALNDPDTLLAQQIAVMAESAGHVFQRPALLNLFRDSGDLPMTLIQISKDIGMLTWRHPELHSVETTAFREQISGLIERLDGQPYGISQQEAQQIMSDIKAWGENQVIRFGPSKAKITSHLEEMLASLRSAEIAPLRIYGLDDDGENKQAQRLGRYPKQALRDDAANFVRIEHPATDELWVSARREFEKKFQHDGMRALGSSTTCGKGVLALLGTEETVAQELLTAHLDILARSQAAAKVMPPLVNGDQGFQVALDRAIRQTSERVLEGLAQARVTDGRRGLNPEQALRAQKQLYQLVSALTEIAEGRAGLRGSRVTAGKARMYLFRTETGLGLVHLLVRPRRSGEFQPPAIEFRLVELEGTPLPGSVVLRLQTTPKGGSYELRFTSDRLNWGVHGPLPTDPFVPDHSFYDGMPTQFEPPNAPLAHETMAHAFAQYAKERFVPEVIEDLPTGN